MYQVQLVTLLAVALRLVAAHYRPISTGDTFHRRDIFWS